MLVYQQDKNTYNVKSTTIFQPAQAALSSPSARACALQQGRASSSGHQVIHQVIRLFISALRFAHMIKEPLVLYGDNDVATATGLERRTLPRSRHWLLKYHATRNYVQQKIIIPKRVPTHDNISDCLTKALELGDWNNVGMRMKGYAPIRLWALWGCPPEHVGGPSRDFSPFPGHSERHVPLMSDA